MAEQAPVDWRTCSQDGCIGIRLRVGGKCLAHAAADERGSELKRIGETGEIDMRGVPITKKLFDQVMAAVQRDADEQPLLTVSRFRRATFEGDAWFLGATFEGDAEFTGATFEGDADFQATFQSDAGFDGATFRRGAGFDQAAFEGDAGFNKAIFEGDAGFNKAAFRGLARFVGATFRGDTEFEEAAFQGEARFVEAKFEGLARFGWTVFHGEAKFVGATFRGDTEFEEANFQGDAGFGRATFQGNAGFRRATFQGNAAFHAVEFRHEARFNLVSFERTRRFGPLLARRGLVLDDVLFAQPVEIEVSTIGLCCRRARFPAGVQFRLRWARVVLDDSDFPAPSILTGIPRLTSDDLKERERRVARAWQRLMAGEISERPRLLSLQRANVTGLGLSNVDMPDCRFARAHNLDKLRLEADVSFATGPSRAGRLSQGGWRQVIAEERAWRAGRSRGWAPPWWPYWVGDSEPEILNPGEIAGLYRALRKGREDIKDEPGAADFYYGEMEMRRRAHRPRGGNNTRARGASWGRVERIILTAYWLVSGYGLRAWRSLVWLAGITAALAVAFHLVGFVHPPKPDTYWTSLLYAFRATLSLTDPEVTLTAWGKFLQAVLRLTGPVLLGLAILALRGRVKR
jgi:Pentapeptide repeats (9 copies)